jgi:hypothetical protein
VALNWLAAIGKCRLGPPTVRGRGEIKFDMAF